MSYSPCVERFKNDLIAYIENPTQKNAISIEQRIPEYILDKSVVIELASEIDQFSVTGKGVYQKISKLSKDYKSLLEESLKEVDKKALLGLIKKEQENLIKLKICNIVDRVASPNNEDYALAKQLATNKGLDFGGR